MGRAMRSFGLLAVVAAAAAGASCGDAIRQGRSPGILVVNGMQAATGDKPTTFTSNLISDVVNMVRTPAPCSDTNPCSVVYNDLGQATLSLVMKDIAVAPTSNNNVTVTRYRVVYTRADGRNTPGVDVPFAIDGAATALIPADGSTVIVGFDLVRNTAKEEAPLVQLINGSNILSVIATVTFYGKDIVGNDVSASGQIQITFANFFG